MTGATIDLGVVGDHRAEPAPARRGRPPRSRRITLAVAALLLPAVVPASAVPGPAQLRQVLSLPLAERGSWVLSGDTLVVTPQVAADVTADVTATARPRSRAYSLTTGRQVWDVELPEGSYPSATADDDNVYFLDPSNTRTYAVHLITGRIRWQASGQPAHAGPNQPLIIAGGTAVPSADGDGSVDYEWTEFRRLDPADGRDRWMRRGRTLAWALSADGRSLYLLESGGDMVVVDADTGSQLRRAALDLPMPDRRSNALLNLTVVGDAIVMMHQAGDALTTRGYDAGTLTRRWETTPPLQWAGARACGRYVCHEGPEAIRAHDARNGRLVWELSGWSGLSETSDGRLLVSEPVGDPRYGVLDPDTGAVTPLGHWGHPSRGNWLIRLSADPDTGSVVAYLPPGGSKPHILGDIRPVIADNCYTSPRYLACAVSGTLAVWRRHSVGRPDP